MRLITFWNTWKKISPQWAFGLRKLCSIDFTEGDVLCKALITIFAQNNFILNVSKALENIELKIIKIDFYYVWRVLLPRTILLHNENKLGLSQDTTTSFCLNRSYKVVIDNFYKKMLLVLISWKKKKLDRTWKRTTWLFLFGRRILKIPWRTPEN